MDCREAQLGLSALIDGEELGLPPQDRASLNQHLQQCADCTRISQEMQTLTQLMRAPEQQYQAPPHLRSRIQTAIRASAPRPEARKGSGWRAWPWAWINFGWASSASLACVATLLLYLGQASTNDIYEQGILDSHLRSLQANHLADVISTDQHTVKPWFAGKLDFSPPTYDFATQGYRLTGGRLDYLAQQPIAALVYQHKLHVINLFVAPSQTVQAERSSSRQGYQLIQWTQAGMRYALVSDMNGKDLMQFKQMLSAQIQQDVH
jgi:anti-sigma factor RsiW